MIWCGCNSFVLRHLAFVYLVIGVGSLSSISIVVDFILLFWAVHRPCSGFGFIAFWLLLFHIVTHFF